MCMHTNKQTHTHTKRYSRLSLPLLWGHDLLFVWFGRPLQQIITNTYTQVHTKTFTNTFTQVHTKNAHQHSHTGTHKKHSQTLLQVHTKTLSNTSTQVHTKTNQHFHTGTHKKTLTYTFTQVHTKNITNTFTQVQIKTFTNTFSFTQVHTCLLYTSPSPRDSGISRMPSSA